MMCGVLNALILSFSVRNRNIVRMKQISKVYTCAFYYVIYNTNLKNCVRMHENTGFLHQNLFSWGCKSGTRMVKYT